MNRGNSSLISSDAIFLFIVYSLCFHQLLIINNFVLCFIIIFLFVLLYNLYSDCKTSPIITNKLDAIQNYFVCDCRKLFRKKQTVAFCCRTKAKKKRKEETLYLVVSVYCMRTKCKTLFVGILRSSICVSS